LIRQEEMGKRKGKKRRDQSKADRQREYPAAKGLVQELP
jgi:hypothetical protein